MKFDSIILGSLIFTTTAAIPIVTTVDSPVPSSSDVQYNCVFENLWTKDRHPRKFPSTGAAVHWTRQILASHGNNYNMWKEGSVASDSVKIMAERGGTADLVMDLENLNNFYEIGYAKYTSTIDPIMRFNDPIAMTSKNHYISAITKMAPSPDWFSGFHDFDALNDQSQTWYKEFTIETFPYDAGTENGDTYIIDNSPTIPARLISQFTTDNVPSNGVFLNKRRNDILPVAKYTCMLNTYSSSEMSIERTNSGIPSSNDVQYNCMFQNLWTKDRHPNEFPEIAAAHWTKQVLASHNIRYSMWSEGSLANDAVETLAEAGGIADILKDLQERDDSYDIGYDKYLYVQDPSVYFEPLEMTSEKRYISAITKLAPSPDWFSGFHDFDAVNEDRNTWYEEFVIPVYPYDAGTEDGDTYTTSNLPSNPRRPITQFTINNIPENEIFLNDNKNEILPVASYTCTISASSLSKRRNKRERRIKGGSNTGLIIAIALSIIATVFTCGVIVYVFLCRRCRKSTTKPDLQLRKSKSELYTDSPSIVSTGNTKEEQIIRELI